MSVALILICLVVGLLIGAVGIGGALLVPALDLVVGIGVHWAVPACMLSYLATGLIGAVVFARHGSIQWPMVWWMTVGALPAAYLGAVSLPNIPVPAVKLSIACLMVVAGLNTLKKSRETVRPGKPVGRIALVGIGLITGFGSAVTGTGGPLIVVPLGLYLGLPVLTTVGLSQAIQIPIAVSASVSNWLQGTLDVALGMAIAASTVIGSLIGAMLVHRLPTEPIRKMLAGLLIVVGAAIAYQVIDASIG